MPETPDFESIARSMITTIVTDDESHRLAINKALAEIAEKLRVVWHAGFEAGGQHETFVKHLKDENNAAHLALDRANAPKTRPVPRRDGDGMQDITIGLVDRINAGQRLVWNARGAADIAKIDLEFADGTVTLKSLDRALRSLDR